VEKVIRWRLRAFPYWPGPGYCCFLFPNIAELYDKIEELERRIEKLEKRKA